MTKQNLPKALIVDIDGTLASNEHRIVLVKDPTGGVKKDWKTYRSLASLDPPFRWCVETLRAFGSIGYTILFVTGRNESERQVTTDWLLKHVPFALIPECLLHMRPDNDYRQDFVVKREIFYREIDAKYDVVMALDDRRQVVEMWRELGLICLQPWDNIY